VQVPGKKSHTRWLLWGIAALSIVALSVLLLLALRDTRVVVEPRSHSVTFNAETEYIAFPALGAATDTLAYAVESFEIEDSEVVPTQGTVTVEEKASGTITVYNESSDSPIRLIANTRFETPDGLVFRSPAAISVPGRRGETPGQVRITVIADQPGEPYNIDVIDRFTLPGLAGSPEFNTIYARSMTPMAGGFSGQRPAVAPVDMQRAMADVRTRLTETSHQQARAIAGTGRIALSEMLEISFQDLPQTAEAGGGARVHQRAIVRVPVFEASAFAEAIARGVSADAEGASIRLVPETGFGARSTSATTTLGIDPISFAMMGSALLVWDVDTDALAAALAGKSQDAFEAIVNAFPGVQEASARIQPFWKSAFPEDATRIRVVVKDPAESL
jgi:hypothetical protein